MSAKDCPNGILEMAPEKFIEKDGVIFDHASFARHCENTQVPASSAAAPAPVDNPSASTTAAPAPVFPVDPKHVGWYQPNPAQPPVPRMAGFIPPAAQQPEQYVTDTVITPVFYGGGSGSGGSYYATSYTTSWRYGSGSFGSFNYGSGSGCAAGGYGLELI